MQLHTSRSAAAPVGHPSRTNLVCVDDATDAKLLQALRADGATVQILDNKPGLTRWDQLALCMFTLGDATGNDRHTTWDALAMGSIPVVKKKKTFKTLYDNSLLTPQGCVYGSHGSSQRCACVARRYRGGPFLVVRKFASVTAAALEAYLGKMAGDARHSDVSALFAPRWFEQLGRGVQGVLHTMHHPSTNAKKEPIWEETWVAAALPAQVERSVSLASGSEPMLEACMKLADKAMFDGRLTLAQDILNKCHHFHATRCVRVEIVFAFSPNPFTTTSPPARISWKQRATWRSCRANERRLHACGMWPQNASS